MSVRDWGAIPVWQHVDPESMRAVPMRTFETGATRNDDRDRLDYEGFLCPQVLTRFAEYMHHHRIQADGSLRDSDNFQKGVPNDAYMKSLMRHIMEVWTIHRVGGSPVDYENALCASLFNIQGLLLNAVK